MRRTVTLVLTVLAMFGALATEAPSTAFAKRKSVLEGQPAVRKRVEMRKHRFEITPQFVVSLNQDFQQFMGGGVLLQFHILDWLAVGAQVAGGGNVNTGLTNEINDQLAAGQTAFQPTQQQFNDHLARINVMFSAHATITPIAGKMMLFSALPLRYDMYGMVGVGGLNITNSYTVANQALQNSCLDVNDPSTDPNACPPENDGFKVGGLFGVGVHLYFNEWVGINFELRDILSKINQGGLDVNGDRKINGDDETVANNLFFGFGATFMLPIHAKISD